LNNSENNFSHRPGDEGNGLAGPVDSAAADTPRLPLQVQATQIAGISGVTLNYQPGDIVDKDYRLVELLGRGGMGAVYSCQHLTLNREYAIKLLSAPDLSKETWSRFQGEARALARLNHPNIVSIYNMGIDRQQCPYYVMDLLSGQTLSEIIYGRGALPIEEALDIFVQVVGGLNSAHNQGIVHRDVKPSNIMIVKQDSDSKPIVKIVDFGIARVSKQDLTSQSQTATGLIFGTPYYMSPEQCQGEKVDARSDVYSLGCALYEALTGRPPFVGDNAFHTFMMHQNDAPPPMRKTAAPVPPALATAVNKMLAKKPSERYQTMSQVEQDLMRIKAGKEIMGQKNLGSTDQPQVTGQEIAPVQTSFASPDAPLEKSSRGRISLKAVGLALIVLTVTAGSGIFYVANSGRPKQAHVALVPPLEPDPDRTAKNNLITDTLPDEDLLTQPKDVLLGFGAGKAEFKDVTPESITHLKDRKERASRKLDRYFKDKLWLSQKFRRGDSFYFPLDISIGAIQIGEGGLVQARGKVSAPAGSKAFLYMICSTKGRPEVLEKFNNDDLTGLAALSRFPQHTMKATHDWSRLDELDFFNPLLKAMPNDLEVADESNLDDIFLPQLDTMTALRTIGLCAPATGSAIIKFNFFKRIRGLKLKRIADFLPLLKVLPECDNLHELWLIHQGTTDDQLEYLTRMKNLENLKILRSQITLASLQYFKRMQKLSTLGLDRNDWTPAQKAEFQRQLPKVKVTYEPVMESTYWQF
jgi:serine/threonine protein kinase